MKLPSKVVTERFEIRRSPSEIFAFLIDLANWRTLDDTLVDVQPTAALGPGSRGTATNRRAVFMRVTTAWEIVEFVEGARFSNRIVGRGYELTEAVDLAPTDTGTSATVTDTLVATSFSGRLMVPLSVGIIRRDLRKREARLKTLLEDGRA